MKQDNCEQPNQTKLSHFHLETIVNSSLDEIFVTDGEGNVLVVNPAGESLYGIEASQLINKNVDELEKNGLFSPALYPIVKKRKEKVSMIQRTKTGKIVHVIANPVFKEDGEIFLIIFTSRDITEIKHLREKIERNEALLKVYESELEELRSFQEPADIIAVSPNMRKIIRTINKIAGVDSTILITGESGVGKGVIATAIHNQSSRKTGAFIHINCGAIPETLIESELFGYDSGAFTGARKEGKKGLIEQANGGTLFLDEIGEMPLSLQVRLLKVIQERKVDPVGSTTSVDIDVRIIAATNKSLKKMVEEGTFRQDLFYRLNVVPIHIPALRTRPEDISYLIDYFLKKYNEKYGLANYFSLEAENALIHYDWPGNVRELENMIERLVVTAEQEEITMEDLVEYMNPGEEGHKYFVTVHDVCSLKQAQEEMEEQLVRRAYEMNKSSYKVAEMLGINQSTAIRKIQKYITGYQQKSKLR